MIPNYNWVQKKKKKFLENILCQPLFIIKSNITLIGIYKTKFVS